MGKKRAIGLDIGSSSIKLAELERHNNEVSLTAFGAEPLLTEAIVDGALMNSFAIVETIKALVQKVGLKTREVVIGVSGHSVVIKRITLPQMTEEELEESVHWVAEQYIPFDISEVNLDAVILKPRSVERGQMEVLLVAAKKEQVADYQAVVKKAGIEPVVVTIDTFALEAVAKANDLFPFDETVVLVDVGASVTTINIQCEGTVAFTRGLCIGGNLFSEELQKQFEVCWEEAEAIKVGGEFAADRHGVVPSEVKRVLERVAKTIASEIQRSIDFYTAITMDPRKARLLLSGGCASIPALQKAIETTSGIPVEMLNPFQNIQIHPKCIGGDLAQQVRDQGWAAIPVGLALRGFQGV